MILNFILINYVDESTYVNVIVTLFLVFAQKYLFGKIIRRNKCPKSCKNGFILILVGSLSNESEKCHFHSLILVDPYHSFYLFYLIYQNISFNFTFLFNNSISSSFLLSNFNIILHISYSFSNYHFKSILRYNVNMLINVILK